MSTKPRILFVDDEAAVLDGLRRVLRPMREEYDFHYCSDPLEALERIIASEVDVLVTDIRMPVLDGLELLARVRTTEPGRRLPVIVLTGSREADLKRRALDLDVTDLLSKPVEVEDLVARLRSALRLKQYEEELRNQNRELEWRVAERTAALARSRREIIWRLAEAAELRDEQTGHHVLRVGWLSFHLGLALDMPQQRANELLLAAPLHDIGKLGVSDMLLRKRGPLSDEERLLMQQHCEIGASILRKRPRLAATLAADDLWPQEDSGNELLEIAARIALHHHERWDGAGYPTGLRADEIPLEARITAVADVFDALCSARPYKPPYDPVVAAEIIRRGAGTQFDPAVVAAFDDVFPLLERVQSEMGNVPAEGTVLELK